MTIFRETIESHVHVKNLVHRRVLLNLVLFDEMTIIIQIISNDHLGELEANLWKALVYVLPQL